MSERVSIEPVDRITVVLDKVIVAESTKGYVVHEQGLDDRYYVPKSDVRAELADGQGKGSCPWKGEWKHLDVTVDGKTIANGAWTYYESKPATEPTRDMVAFYGNKFTVSRG